MAKYTIEVNGIYNLQILSSIAEMLDADERDDIDDVSLYLVESLPMLMDTLMAHISLSNEIANNPEKWQNIAKRVESLARSIGEKVDASGEA